MRERLDALQRSGSPPGLARRSAIRGSRRSRTRATERWRGGRGVCCPAGRPPRHRLGLASSAPRFPW
eukprot:8558863-Pyramimonas_sp.AAC.1